MRAGRLMAAGLILGALAAPVEALVPPAEVLRDQLRGAGLDAVEPIGAAGRMLRGSLPGDGGLRVLLFAGCGAGGDASRRAALAAVADLARTPRRHTLEVVACSGDLGSGDGARQAAVRWLELHPGAAAREAVLAALHLELDDRGGTEGVGLVSSSAGSGERRLPPAWLAHAVLEGGRAGGGYLGIGDRYWPAMGQLLGRLCRSRSSSGAEPFLGAGVPALTLAGGGHETRWPTVLAAIARRLDSLVGRPRDDDVYLALAGRVWSRRDLYWAGLAAWVALIAGGRPGAWRGAGGDERRRRGRRYLPGFAFRVLFLVALLTTPAATLVLLAPAALVTLVPLRRPAARWLGRGVAVLPAALFASYWALGLVAGWIELWPAQPLRAALVAGGVLLALWLIGRRGAGGRFATAS